MKRRRPNTSRKVPADLLHGWEPDLFSSRLSAPVRSLFDALEQPAADSAGVVDSSRPSALTTFAVQCYVTVRVVLSEVVAADPRSAAQIARDRFCANEQNQDAEFVEELCSFLVQVVGDSDPSKTALFRTEWTPVPADDAEDADERRPP